MAEAAGQANRTARRSVPPSADTAKRNAAGKRTRDAEATRRRILNAAVREFARLGLGGARIDAIAARSRANKRMIYHYFRSKDELFRAVLEHVYADIRAAEQALDLDRLDPATALRSFVVFTWEYYLDHPDFLALIEAANLHKARHLRTSQRFRAMHDALVPLLGGILERGASDGVFRAGIDPVQLYMTIAAIGFYYLTNRYTQELMYGRELMTPDALATRLAFNVDTVMRLVART